MIICYLKHHWDGGNAVLGFATDWVRILVSKATDSSHKVKVGKTMFPLFLGRFSSDPFYTCKGMHDISDEFEIWSNRT